MKSPTAEDEMTREQLLGRIGSLTGQLQEARKRAAYEGALRKIAEDDADRLFASHSLWDADVLTKHREALAARRRFTRRVRASAS